MAKNNVYQEITNIIIDMLNEGTIAWTQSWAINGYTPENAPRNPVTGTIYTGVNSMLLVAYTLRNDYKSPFFVTFKQAKQLGGTVAKGATGHRVVWWNFQKQKDEKTGEDTSYGYLKKFTVFNIEQCEGIDTSKFPDIETYESEFEPIDFAQQLIDDMPDAPQIYHAEQRAYYAPEKDAVNLPQPASFATTDQYYSVAFHELAHSTGHKSRLGRDLTGYKGGKKYAREELIAEMTSAMLCNIAGLSKVIDNQARYIQFWLNALQEDKNMIIWAASRAQKAAQYILNETSDKVAVAS